MAKDRFTQVDGTSPVEAALKAEKLDVPRSAFDLSRLVVTQSPFGLIQVIDYKHCAPNTTVTPQYDVLVSSRNPLVRKPYTGARYYVKTYKIYDRDLWKGAPNHVTRGRTGKLTKDLPRVKLRYLLEGGEGEDDKLYSVATPLSLADQLGVPISRYDTSKDEILSYEMSEEVVGDESSDVAKVYGSPEYVNALPFVFYQKICRNFFNSNLLQDNAAWYPEDEEAFILGYSADVVNVLDEDNPLLSDADFIALDHSAAGSVCVPTNDASDSPVSLTDLHYCQFKGDYFNTGSPFPNLLRGDTPAMSLDLIAKATATAIELATEYIKAGESDALTVGQTSDNTRYRFGKLNGKATPFGDTVTSVTPAWTKDDFNALVDNFNQRLETKISTEALAQIASSIASATINLNDLRALQTYTLMRERMALCDGSYNSLVKTMFGISPHWNTHEPEYIGGFYGDIQYNEVVSNTTNADVQLGDTASRGYSVQRGSVGKIHFEDFGYYMTVLYIVQDTMYCQGLEHELSDISYDDVYFPMKENLAPMSIRNQELFYDDGAVNANDEPFAYTERYAYEKSRRNTCHGLPALSADLAAFDNALVQKRLFSETPQFNEAFVTMSPDNVDMSLFSVPTSYPFDIAVNCNVDMVAPMSYVTKTGKAVIQ